MNKNHKNNETAMLIGLGAAVLGVIGAAGVFLVEHFGQKKMRTAMAQELARLDMELAKVRQDLQRLQSQRSSERDRPTRHHRRSNHVNHSKKANSVISATTDDYLSASNMDSSDLEFYDVTDDENDDTITSSDLDSLLNELDRKLDMGNVEVIEETLQKLEDLCLEHPENAELLYRIGKAHYKVADMSEDNELIQKRLEKGIEACSSALSVAPEHAEVHKWYAVLIGSRSDFSPIQQKINDGHLFKKHVDIALSINPNDYSLHYMLGRFEYEIAALKWYERKVAAAIFGEPPSGTYEDAYRHFLEADKLAPFGWKDNCWMLAKCKIALGEYKEALEWLDKAKTCTHSTDSKVDQEVEQLLEKYRSYR